MGEILLLKLFLKNQLKWGIYNPFENLLVGNWKGPVCPSGRPANGQIFDRWALRSTARLTVPDPESNGSLADRPPGRPELDTESRLSVRSTDPVDRPGRPGQFPESRALWTVDRPGRPATSPMLACTLVHVGRPHRSTDYYCGRPVRSTGSKPVSKFWD